MCELFGMSSRDVTSATFSLETLAARGNRTHHLGDGWGIGFYEGNDIRLFREPEPAGESAWVRFIATQQIRSHLLFSHLRHATQGEVSLRNTQPFARELGGRMHLFAHNGRLPDIERHLAGEWGRYRPIGSTDSEVAFCVLLERMGDLWVGATPTLQARFAVAFNLARDLRSIGPANFLYSDGEYLFAHADRRLQKDGGTAPPGLHVLNRTCAVVPDDLEHAGIFLGQAECFTIVASIPLTREAWRPLGEGEVIVVRDGAILPTPPLVHIGV